MGTLLELKNVTKIYEGGVLANHNICFDVREGEIHALVGENGAGKSTLMKILFGLIPITSGQVFLRGEEVHFNSSSDAIAAGIGMVHQHFMLVDSLTGAENLMLGIKEEKFISNRKEDVEKTRAIAAKYNFDIDPQRRVRDMSVGMKQKLEILKILYRGAKLIILDEPTVGLDPRQITEIRELIRQLGKEHTVILSSHILSEVQQVCTTILILSKGKLVACDTPENLERLFAGKSTVELTVEAAEKEIPGILSGVSHIVSRTAKARQDGACDVTLELDVPAENEVCREIFFAFSKAGKAILRMTAGKASLEDIFMELTDSGKGEETK